MKRSSLKLNAAMILTGCFPFLIASCSATKPSLPSASTNPKPFETARAFDHSHGELDHLLKKYVKNGLVNYRGILSESDAFYRYVTSLGAVSSPTVNKWSREQQMAYWINAYNAFTIQAIIERYPIRGRSLVGIFFPRNSILQISGIWSRLTFNAGGYNLTLGQIEHDVLRKGFIDPRIHFAIVCASISCPVLRPEAYRFDVLGRQLNEQAIQFVNDTTRGARWDADQKRLYVSKIFKWFKEDFNPTTISIGSSNQPHTTSDPVLDFIRIYLRNESFAQALAADQDIRLSYLAYDWRLNEQIQTTRSLPESPDTDG
jgi:hypothetical protein